MSAPTRQTIAAARRDPVVFAEALVGQPLWPHQAEVVRSDARVRVLCSGRQAGKSHVVAIMALHEAFRAPGQTVLVISATDDAAKRVLATVAAFATAPLLKGSVIDENASKLTLSTGSVVMSIPASQRQVRGISADLLILDEACFLDQQLWEAARWTTIARAGSRVVMASTPYGRKDHFFAVAFRAGQAETRVDGFASFHWPSTVSPLVDPALLEVWRETSTDREFRREVLAEWVDDAGAYFTAAELDQVSEPGYPMTAPADAHGRAGVAGVDWGFASDANTIVVIGTDPALAKERGTEGPVYCVPWFEEHFTLPYARFIERIVEVAEGYRLRRIVPEENGVGSMPCQELTAAMRRARNSAQVVGVHTDARLKEDGFGWLKVLAQRGRLALPREPRLLRQLAALEYETMESGLTRIAVPERAGHDDLAMGLCLGASFLREHPALPPARFHRPRGSITGPLMPTGRRLKMADIEAGVRPWL